MFLVWWSGGRASACETESLGKWRRRSYRFQLFGDVHRPAKRVSVAMVGLQCNLRSPGCGPLKGPDRYLGFVLFMTRGKRGLMRGDQIHPVGGFSLLPVPACTRHSRIHSTVRWVGEDTSLRRLLSPFWDDDGLGGED